MIKRYIIAVFTCMVLLGCKKEGIPSERAACGDNDPVNDLPWLKALINSEQQGVLNALSVKRFEFDGQTLFQLFNHADVVCDVLRLRLQRE